jgi:hypothetical protein
MRLQPSEAAVAAALLLLPVAAGCRGGGTTTSKTDLLDVPSAREWRLADGEPRIGQPGERLEFGDFASGGAVEVAVVGRSRVGGDPNGLIVELTRNGRRWRMEAFRQRSASLQALGVREPGKPWILLDPPLIVARLPVSTGQSLPWRGVLRTGKQRMAATGESRIEDPVSLRMPDGSRREAWPVRTTIALADGTTSTAAIQEVRWLVPGLGLVARDRVEDNSEVRLSLRARRSGISSR